MIETKEAVESIDEIMAVNGLDFIFLDMQIIHFL